MKRRHHPTAALDAVLLIAALLVLAALASPAHAQYGGGPSVFVDPVRVPVGTAFSVFGQTCPASSAVSISIDGIPGEVGTATTDASGIFSVASIPAPASFVAGTTYTIRATCLGLTATTILNAVCADGTDPIGGSCPAPGSPTTTIPGGGSGTPAGEVGTGGGTGTATDTIAFTGAGRATQLLQVGATLVGLGMFLLLVVRRRQQPSPA